MKDWTNQFCTLFDHRYLPRGVVLYHSLARHCVDFRLRALCLDPQAEAGLRALRLHHVDVIPRAELESADPELGALKATRTHAEYCWTAVSALCLHCLQREPNLAAITYLDADMAFL